MPTVTFAKPFRFSPDGIDIVDYKLGKREVSNRCAEAAQEAGVLAEAEPKAARSRKAPETAARSAAPETK